jgi:hypothetical protein
MEVSEKERKKERKKERREIEQFLKQTWFASLGERAGE